MHLQRELMNFDLWHKRLHSRKFDSSGRGRHAIRRAASRCQAQRFLAADALRCRVRKTGQRRVTRAHG